MKHFYWVLLFTIAVFGSCKKSDSVSPGSSPADLGTINTQLKGTWLTSSTIMYYNASGDQTMLSDDFPKYDLYFDGQTSMQLVGKIAAIPSFSTTYKLSNDAKSAYFNYTDQVAVSHTMQIQTLSATELYFSETVNYSQPVTDPGGRFAYSKKVNTYKCSRR